MIDKLKLMETLLCITSAPGISGTNSENIAADKIVEILKDIQYFKQNPESLRLIKIKDDPFDRSFVAAFFQSKIKTNKTIILTGHFDVVDVEEFGHLKPLAFSPLEYTKRISELSLDEDSLKDLQSGDWIFGRGIADMKFGLALAIELIRDFSARKDFVGNILFLAVPGEETNSEGMLAAAEYLVELQNEKQCEFLGLLLPECSLQGSSDDKNKYIHIGACGKIMPAFFFAGKETHVSSPFNGIDPNLLASEVNRLLELNTDFCDISKGIASPPPICLKQMDFKELYSVQTSIYAASYYNMITLSLNAAELTKKLKKLCGQAIENTLGIINKNIKSFEQISGNKINCLPIKPIVVSYNELYLKVRASYGEEFDHFIDNKIIEWRKKGMDNQIISLNIIKETYEKYTDKTPMIVIAFAPPYYPDRFPDLSSKEVKSFINAIDELIEYGYKKHKINIKKTNYYMGISDLSYTGLSDDSSIEEVCSNMPGSGKVYSLPVKYLKQLDITGIVLGAYGKDMHKYTERLNISYSFDVLPDLYEYLINYLFKKDN